MKDRNAKEIRIGLGLSQERFAQFLGVSAQTVRRWEAGLTRPLPIIGVRLKQLEREIDARQETKGEQMNKKDGTSTAKAGFEVGMGGLFKGIGNMFDLISRMSAEGKEEYSNTGTVEAAGGKVKGVYGFSVRMGLGGKPVVEQFGNIKETGSGPAVSETREPLVDVMDEGQHITVVAELPGVEQEDIRVKVTGDVLEVSASAGDRKYHREVVLPAAADASSIKTSYKNGVLEIKLDKQR
ncbi:MAG: Hsp20 family protein [Chloroflexi bacterium]|nr:Hsp20 family protein [Chloroflexota bacterium]